MTRQLKVLAIAAFALAPLSPNTLAVTLNGEYVIGTNITDNGSNSYTFDYSVTNYNQQINPGIQPVGLDAFYVSVPDTSAITNITNPQIFTNTWPQYSYWTSSFISIGGKDYIQWWGVEWNSVYPVTATAHFSFTANNVNIGTVEANVITFWNSNSVPPPAYFSSGAYYTNYAAALPGPVAVPEPSAFLLLSAGLISLCLLSCARQAQSPM